MAKMGLRKRIRNVSPEELASAPDGILIAWNFIRIREGLGLTQAQAAELGQVVVSYVGKVESAKVSFGTRAQQKWSKIFGVDRTEFLMKPDVAIGVIGAITDKGVITRYTAGHELEHVPPLTGHESDSLFCLKVLSDTVYPHLRRNSYVYIIKVPLSVVRNDHLVLYGERGEPDSVKEVEWLPNGKILLKGVGKGTTITKEANELPTVQKVVFISM
jgi:transcriptional regulator with XRE-family HTH domain